MIKGNKHMRVLLTGSEGYIGTHLMRYLMNKTDWDVSGIDRKSGFDLLGDRSIGHIDTYDCIVHLACETGVRASARHPHRYMEDNIKMTIALLNQAKEYQIPTLVASSSSVHELKSPYAYSKYAIEQICQSYPFRYFTRIFRPFTVYGHTTKDVFRANMLYGMIQNDRVPNEIYNAKRDYTHIEDVCQALMLLILNRKKGASNRIYEIGYCNPISTKQFLFDQGVDISDITFRDADHPSYSESSFTCASPSSLYRLGWSPKHIKRG